MTHSFALQAAAYLALSGDAGVRETLGDPPRLYDEAPPDAAFPYALIGEARVAPLAGHDGAFEHDLRLHVFSRDGGRRAAKRIVDAFYDALHEAPLDVEGARLVSLRFVFADYFRREPTFYAATARFRAVTEGSA